MKLIELTQGRFAVVDDEDFEWLSEWKWSYSRQKHWKTGYARRTSSRTQSILMHIEIMKRHKQWKKETQIDHINGCGCDNRKSNLRLVNSSLQIANSSRRLDNTSKVTGVTRHRSGKWEARIDISGGRKYLGLYVKKTDAIAARKAAELQYFKEYRYNPTNVCPLAHTGQCPECAARLKETK